MACLKHNSKSIQNLIPTSFDITFANLCENDGGMRVFIFSLIVKSSLPWHPYTLDLFTF